MSQAIPPKRRVHAIALLEPVERTSPAGDSGRSCLSQAICNNQRRWLSMGCRCVPIIPQGDVIPFPNQPSILEFGRINLRPALYKIRHLFTSWAERDLRQIPDYRVLPPGEVPQ